MIIATWNVNSIKARLDHVLRWLGEHKPDVLMLQELKGLECPADAFRQQGYTCAFVAQKTYNGVATLTRTPVSPLLTRLPGDEADEQARYLEVEHSGLRLINVYAPNGNPVDSEKYTYKLQWLERLRLHIAGLRAKALPFVIGGDFNIIPEERDCYDPKAWHDDALFRLESRQQFRALMNLGLTDALRVSNGNGGEYTFWDYQAGAWPQNKGIRIDHFLLSPDIADRLRSCRIDKAPRGWDKASDHTPVLLEIGL
ncbi:MAG: exodeoxyribonuclease III [Micavibrio aeruginosavorus]|uniref:Exodeoxyribonuclease III n=1 Tax=Micavibrio aeruginosavorus TaxID=349221 RepID=A0A7T5R3Z3_9BACT|nr:MAG: exodeoxyribonuclease III [Micavibrio aeruginosavorus]